MSLLPGKQEGVKQGKLQRKNDPKQGFEIPKDEATWNKGMIAM